MCGTREKSNSCFKILKQNCKVASCEIPVCCVIGQGGSNILNPCLLCNLTRKSISDLKSWFHDKWDRRDRNLKISSILRWELIRGKWIQSKYWNKSRWYRLAPREESPGSERESSATWGWAYSSHKAGQLSVRWSPRDCWETGHLPAYALEKSRWSSVHPRLDKDVELD